MGSAVEPTVLVTGAAGFIGHRLVQRLLDADATVLAVDDLSAGFGWQRPPRTGLNRIELDIGDRRGLERVCRQAAPDVVVHLAARHFIPYCRAHPEETIRCNLGGTEALLAALDPRKPVRIVFASTAAVYQPTAAATRETDPMDGDDDVYAYTKRRAEGMLRGYARARAARCDVRIGRIFNVFGPGDGNPHVIPEILAQAGRGDTLRLGNLDTRRDYIFLDDVVTALIHLVSARAAPATVNIGSGVPRSVTDIVTACAALTGRPLAVASDAQRRRGQDRPNLYADTTILHTLLPCLAARTFRDGLAVTLAAAGLIDTTSEVRA
jgi:UDP-glucose 4-epimerase